MPSFNPLVLCECSGSIEDSTLKLLILGKGRHGKDTVAEILRDEYGLSFMSSSLACAEKVVYPAIKDTHNYRSVEECFNDRHNHRELWAQLISAYNYADPSRLAREILSECDVYVGMRSQREFEAARHLFDHIIWVDASLRLPDAEDSTMLIKWEPSFYTIYNNYGIPELQSAVYEVMANISDYVPF